MPRYLIDRVLPGAGRLTPAELRDIARKSNAVLERLGPGIVWEQSFVIDDGIRCLYTAPSPEPIREHARLAGFPCDRIAEIRAVISPRTADEPVPAGT